MVVVHFLEKNTVVLSQLRSEIPYVDEQIRIKGRKGTVLSVKKIDDKVVHVQVLFEVVKQTPQILKDTKKKKR